MSRKPLLMMLALVLSSGTAHAVIIDFDAFANSSYAPGTAIGSEDGFSLFHHATGTSNLGINSLFSPTGQGVSQNWEGTPVLPVAPVL